MEKKIQQLVIDLGMFAVGLALTISGSIISNGGWIMILIGLVLVCHLYTYDAADDNQ